MSTRREHRRKKGTGASGARAIAQALLALVFVLLFGLLLWLVQDPVQDANPEETARQPQQEELMPSQEASPATEVVDAGETAPAVFSGESLGSLEGVVLDTAGKPVSGARIWLRPISPPGEECQAAQSGANGAFVLRGLGPGVYALTAQRPYDARLSLDPLEVRLEAGEQRRGLRLLLEARKGLTVRAEVFGEDHDRIAGAEVAALGPVAAQGLTDENGICLLEGLPEGDYTFRATAAGYSELAHQVTISPGQTDVAFRLERAGAVSGRVLRASDGQPVPEFELALLSAAYERTPSLPDQPLQRFINEDGSFLLTSAPEGRHNLYARAPGLAPAIQPISVKAGETTADIEFRLTAGAIVQGMVKNWEGRPIAGAKLFCGGESIQVMRQVKPLSFSDPEGRFNLDSLTPGLTRIAAFHPDYVPSQVDVDLNPGRNSPVNLVLGLGGIIEGRVTLDGIPVEQAAVQVFPVDRIPTIDSSTSFVTRTGSDGTFRLTDLMPGEFNVELSRREALEDGTGRFDQQVVQQAIVSPGMVTEVIFDLQTHQGIVTGTITDNSNTSLRAQIHVTVFKDSGGEESFTGRCEDGRYTIEKIAAGPARVVATLFDADSRPRSRVREAMVRPGHQTVVNFDFSSGAYISGQVLNASPEETVEVLIFQGAVTDLEYILTVLFKAGPSPLLTMVDVDTGGQFYVPCIEPGEVTVVAISFISDIPSMDALNDLINRIRSDLLVVHLEAPGLTGLQLQLR